MYNLHRLRIHGDDDPKIFCDPVKKEPADPEVIAHVDTLVGANLEFPLK
jgi:hypothetical protein